MKHLRFNRAIVAIAMMLIGWLPTLAHDIEVDGIYYSFTSSKTVEVSYKGDYSYSYDEEYVGNVVIPLSVNYNGITYSVTSIGNETFNSCSSLFGIQIPNSVTSIGDHAFYFCSKLEDVEIGSNVISIGKEAFWGCRNLTSIEIPNSVKSIGSSVFIDCPNLIDIVIGNSVTSIGDYAFYSCSSLTKITCLATTPPTISSNTFYPYSADLYVPFGCKAEYEATEYWKNFNIKEIFTPLTSVTLNEASATLEIAESLLLIATMLPENATNKCVTWSSSDEAVAVVDDNGVVTAISVGEAIITATAIDGSGVSATCHVTVVPTLAMSIELDKTEYNVEEKSDFQLLATILPEHTTNKDIAWSSSDKWVASVDNNGLVTVYAVGEATITATTTDGTNLSATCRINVYSGIDGVNGDDVIVATVGDNIVVKNAKFGSVVNVYASNGALVASEEATDGSVVVEAPVKGVYVVKVGKQTVKVII